MKIIVICALVCFTVVVASPASRTKEAPYPTPGYPQGPAFGVPGEYGPPAMPETTVAPTATEVAQTTTQAAEEESEETSEVVIEQSTEVNPEENEKPTEQSPEETAVDAEGNDNQTEQNPAGNDENPEENETQTEQNPEETVADPEENAVDTESQTEDVVTVTPATADYDYEEEEQNQKLVLDDGTLSSGSYYIYHPDGLLQKVIYSTKHEDGNRAYSAQLRYQHVEHIKHPIYTYDPETHIFRPLHL